MPKLLACIKCGFNECEHDERIAQATVGDDLPQTPYTHTLMVCLMTGGYKRNPLLENDDIDRVAELAPAQQLGDEYLSHEQMR